MKSPHALLDGKKRSKPRRRVSPKPSNALSRSTLPIPSLVMREDAEALVTQCIGIGARREPLRKELLEGLVHRRVESAKLSRREHLAKIAEAYATFLFLTAEADFDEIITEIAAKLDVRLRTDTDPLRVILGSIISYGDQSAEAENQNATRLYSRDAKAIHHLIRQEILPSAVVQRAELPNEGLDKWSRRSRSTDRTGGTGNANGNGDGEPGADPDSKPVRVSWTGLDGKRKQINVAPHMAGALRLSMMLLKERSDAPDDEIFSGTANSIFWKLCIALGASRGVIDQAKRTIR